MPARTHIVSFRIEDAGNADARRNSLIEAVHRLSDVTVWEETTSLILLKSEKSVHELASDLYMLSEMRHDIDTLLVIDLTTARYATHGKVEFPSTLESFFLDASS